MPTSRRTFLEEVSFASLIAGFPLSAQAALTKYAEKPPDPVFPKALQPGMTVAIVTPSSAGGGLADTEFGVEIVKALGFKPKVFPHVGEETRYLAGPDEHRAADLNAAFADTSVDAIFCLHGGYGASRILPLLDYETIKKNPKVICGYSDITALLNAIHRLTGLVTFHGPVGSEVQTDYTLASFRKVLMTAQPAGRVAEPPAPKGPPKEIVLDKDNWIYKLAPGRGKGRLVGGNISVFSTLVGTPCEP